MTKHILPIVILIISFESNGQNAKQLLQQSYSKCLAIKSGYYEMEKRMKWMDVKDTNIYGQYKFYFKKLKNDSLYTVSFNSELLHKGEYIRNVMYTGNDYVTYSTKDSSAIIMAKDKWAKKIMEKRHNDIFNFYLPFTTVECTPLPKASDYIDNRHTFKFIAKEIQNNMLCYHIQMVEFPKYNTAEIMYTIETRYDYWINVQDMIPIKYSASSKILYGRDTLNEYSSYSLKKYNLNNQQIKKLMPLSLSSIPLYCNIQDYVETKKIDLLTKGSMAPNWTLISLDNKNISLTDYKGQIILIDFFYKACYPCMKAFPILQSLNQKYKSKGLTVIGIDPFDKGSDDIKKFITKRGITYKILLDDKDVANSYNVTGYPTIYLIDKTGKIIYANSGFNEGFENKLEELIKNNL